MLQHFKTHMKPNSRQNSQNLLLQHARVVQNEHQGQGGSVFDSGVFAPPTQAIVHSNPDQRLLYQRNSLTEEQRPQFYPRFTMPLDPERREQLLKLLPNIEQLREQIYRNLQERRVQSPSSSSDPKKI